MRKHADREIDFVVGDAAARFLWPRGADDEIDIGRVAADAAHDRGQRLDAHGEPEGALRVAGSNSVPVETIERMSASTGWTCG
jgi:hypothetical protein